MWYPNTTKLEGLSTPSYDTYNFMDVKPTLLPNDGCGSSDCGYTSYLQVLVISPNFGVYSELFL